jgi:Tfp pilus assembly protein PilW
MSDRGFTLVELLVACLVLLAVMGAVAAMAMPARHAFERTLAGADLSSGSRAALDLLAADLREAGSGGSVGAHSPGLAGVAAVVTPLADLDSGGVASPARAIRVMRIARGAPQGILAQPVLAGDSTLELGTTSQCTDTGPACGFGPGMAAVVFDRARSAMVVVASVAAGGIVQLVAAVPAGFSTGAAVAAIVVTTYGVRTGPDGSARLVRRSAGGAEQPMLHDVVDFAIVVKGRARGPRPAPAVEGETGGEAWPDYGPAPPREFADDPRDVWPPGENCTIARNGDGVAIPRLASLGDAREPVLLTTAILTDGPWCADPFDASAFDADLLRLSTIEIRLRVEAPAAAFRGPAGPMFRRAGTQTHAARWVPDVELRITLGLRNLL